VDISFDCGNFKTVLVVRRFIIVSFCLLPWFN